MEELKVKGIVLKNVDLKDSDKLITIFSLEKGLIKAKIRGVKKPKAKLAFATQPFAFIEFVLVEKSGYYTIINAASIDQFFEITADFDNYVFMMSCLEICEKNIVENDSNSQLFFLLLKSLKAVCYEKVPAENVFIKFLLESIKLFGYSFEIQNCPVCGKDAEISNFYSFETHGFLCNKCLSGSTGFEVGERVFKILQLIDQTSLESLDSLKFLSMDDVVVAINLLCREFKAMTGEEISTVKQYL